MATKAAKNSRTSRTSSKKKSSGATHSAAKNKKGALSATKAATATDRYQDDLLTRGDAQELDKQGKLPLDATHAIVGKDKSGKPIVKRARFKAY